MQDNLIHRHPLQEQWNELFREGRLNELVSGLLPLIDKDRTAAIHFERLFSRKTVLFRLDGRTVSLLKEKAEDGSALARFALGRWHICTMPESDSVQTSVRLFEQAAEGGLAAAYSALGQAWAYGDMGIVDMSRAQTYYKKGENSDIGKRLRLQELIFGQPPYITETHPEEAVALADAFIRADINAGLSPNPDWYICKANAIETLDGRSAAVEYYRLAAETGMSGAWFDLAIALGYGGGEELADERQYRLCLMEGCRREDPFCLFLNALDKVEDWEEMPEYERIMAGKQLVLDLEKSHELGFNTAARVIGDIYYYGHYGQKEDDALAWQWYAKAALLRCPEAYEMMFEMVAEHRIEKDDAFMDMLALHGTRAGSEELLEETIYAYRKGRLSEFAAEIERYYLPLFGADDLIDDDGRFDAYA